MAIAEIDADKLTQFMDRALDAALVVMGDRLGPRGAARLRCHGHGPDVHEGRGRFHAEAAGAYSGHSYDLVTMFDSLHAIGDPVGAARRVRRTLVWMIVEPHAGDRMGDDLNPVGRASLSRDVGLALGAHAGEARVRDVAAAGGSTRFRRVAKTPLHFVFAARP